MLSSVMIVVPPLRERGADIDLLAYKFSSDFAERYRVDPVEISLAGIDSTGESALLMAEKFGVDGALWNGTTVHCLFAGGNGFTAPLPLAGKCATA